MFIRIIARTKKKIEKVGGRLIYGRLNERKNKSHSSPSSKRIRLGSGSIAGPESLGIGGTAIGKGSRKNKLAHLRWHDERGFAGGRYRVSRHAPGKSHLPGKSEILQTEGLGKNLTVGKRWERVKGIEPSYAAWEAAVLPLNYTRIRSDFIVW